MPSHLAKRTDSYMRSCSLYKIPHSLSHKEPSYHLCRVILAFWSLFATPSGTLGLGKRDIHSRHIELTPPLTNETTFTLERLTSLILYPWDWCRYHQLTPMEYRKVTQTDEHAVLWSWYATLTHLCCLYTVPYAICDVSIVTVPVWGQGVCSSVIRGAFVIALEWIMVGRSSCHHHWLFWDLNAWLDACKSCILTTNPQLLRWIYVEYKQKEKRCSFQTALCLQSIEWWKSLNFSEPPTQSDHMTPTQSEHLAPSIWSHDPNSIWSPDPTQSDHMILINIKLNVLTESVMIAQWGKWIPRSVLSVARVPFPAMAKYFKEFFWLTTICQPVLSQPGGKWLNLPSMAL